MRSSLKLGIFFFALAAAPAAAASGGAGAVYVMTNAPAGNSVIAYDRAGDGSLTPAGVFPTGGAGTGNISGFAIGTDGSAALLDPSGVTAVTGGNPTDVAISHDGQYLYARVAALSAIAIFRIESDGALTALPRLTGTPGGLAGLAAF